MKSTGFLTVRANWSAGHLDTLDVALIRPPVARVFVGQLPEAVVKAVPYLYSLCANAQRTASHAALSAAAGQERREADHGELWIEFLHENFWRLLLDWPQALGLPKAQEAFAAWRDVRHGSARLEASRDLVASTLRPLAEQFLSRLIDRENHRFHAPALNPSAWLEYWLGFQQQAPVGETPNSAGEALRARLREVEDALCALADARPYPIEAVGRDGWGVAQCLTARGVLTHAVHLVDGVVANYRIHAPTDERFADVSALARLFDGQSCASLAEARQRLEQAILALDPCVPFAVEMNHA